MKNIFVKIVSIAALAGSLLALGYITSQKAVAATPYQRAASAVKAPNCPVCHMQLKTHKMKGYDVAVRLKKGGPIFYCCNSCKMPESVLVHPKHQSSKHHTKKHETKHEKAVMCPVCHMALKTHKEKGYDVAVRLKKGGPILYCCNGCKMPNSVLVHPKHQSSKHHTNKH